MTLDQHPWRSTEPITPLPAGASMPAPTARDPGRRSPGLRAILAASVLSAILASGGTAAILLASVPPAAAPATATTAVPTPAPQAGATQTRLDAGSAVATVAAAIEPSVVTITTTGGGRFASAGGSGIVVSADGLILTTTLAAPADATYTVLFSNEREATARVVASDARNGLVLLRASATGLVPVSLAAEDSLHVGQTVIAVGSPLGEFTDTVTAGIVSGLGRSIDLRDPSTSQRVTLDGLIQTDAAVNAGSSGGPLLDAGGTVVGIIATSAANGQGIGFAIPVSVARDFVAGAAP